MELASFSENIITDTTERGLELQINIDAIVPDYFDVIEQRLKDIESRSKPKKNEKKSALQSEKQLLEMQREAFAEMLTCPVKLPDGSITSFLKGWDLTENGLPVACNKKSLLRLPPRAVQEIWEFCKAKATTVKKRLDEVETSDNMQGGSQAIRLVGQGT
jgi:hypothetical protein